MQTIRRGLLALALLLLPSAASGQATLIGTIGADSRTTPVSAAAPLPVTGTVTTTTTAQTGAGAVTATTARTVTATDSPEIPHLTAIETYTGASQAYDAALNLAVQTEGAAEGTRSVLVGGTDGTLARPLLTDIGGRLQVEDAAVDATTGATSAAVPASAQLMGAADSVSGTMMPLRVYDADTAGGNDFRLGTVPLLAGAGGGTPASAGAGAVDAGTQRTTLAADDPAVVSLGTLDDVVGAPAAAAPSKGALVMGQFGANTRAITTDDSGRINVNTVTWNGSVLESGAGNSNSGSIRVVQASIASGTSDHVDVDASEVAVLAAKAGRRFARIQVYADVDGGVCCALGATTNACADGIMLDASPAAGKAGGSAEWEGYGGAITCRAAGAWTVTVASEEW